MPSWLDFNQIENWVSNAWWTYPLIFSVAAVDAFFPVVPSETVVVIAGNLSSNGDLSLPLVILVAACGAIVGDNVCYGIGTFLGERTVQRWFSGEKSRKRLEWAEHALDTRGAYIIILARFIPGGRTAITFSAGYIHAFPWRRFIVYDVAAGLLWATYASLLGYLGGKTFQNHPWWGLGLALAGALTLSFLVEVGRHMWSRWRGAPA